MKITNEKQAAKALTKLTALHTISSGSVLINGQGTVNMLKLYKALEGKAAFQTWVSAYMDRADAKIEGEDFVYKNSDLLNDTKQEVSLTDLYVSYDVAERIAVLSNGTIGKAILKDLQAVKKIAKALVQLQLENQDRLLKALGNGVCTSDQARASGYLTAKEIKEILGLKTSPQVIKAITEYYVLPIIQAGSHTFISLVHFIPAWNQWKSESELKSVVSKCTYTHTFSNTVFEA